MVRGSEASPALLSLQDSGDYPLIAAGATYKKFKVT